MSLAPLHCNLLDSFAELRFQLQATSKHGIYDERNAMLDHLHPRSSHCQDVSPQGDHHGLTAQ
jgi:hypothetical protein